MHNQAWACLQTTDSQVWHRTLFGLDVAPQRCIQGQKGRTHTILTAWQRPEQVCGGMTVIWEMCLNQQKKSKLEAGLVHFATAAAVRNYRLGPFRGFLWPLGSESRRKIWYVPSDRLYYESELYSRPQWSLLKSSKKANIAVKRQQTVSRSHHKLNYGPRLFPSLAAHIS